MNRKSRDIKNQWGKKSISTIGLLVILAILSSFMIQPTLKGTWRFAGDITNGKKQAAPVDYILQRKYTQLHFEAFFIEKGSAPEKYEAGNYNLKGDSCFETQTYSSQPSKLMGITVHYTCQVRNDTLILKGTLPNGTAVEEYWKRLK